MKTTESEYEDFFEYFRQCTCDENDIMKQIMDFKMVHSKLVFGGLAAREFITLGLLKAYADYITDISSFSDDGDSDNQEITRHSVTTVIPETGVNVSVLANCLEVSMPQVSRLLNSMENKGYIARSMNHKDRRVIYVKITDKGRLISKCAVEEYKDYMKKVTDTMGKERLQTLIDMLYELNGIMNELRTPVHH